MHRKIRIGELAPAIGSTVKTLQLWIARHDHIRPTAPQTGAWWEFSFGDVAIFAIARYLVEVGMPVAGAFTYSKAIVEKRWPGLFEEDPHWSIGANNYVIDFHFGPSTHFAEMSTWGVSSIEPEGTWSRLKRGLDAIDNKEFPARVVVTAYLGAIIVDAFGNLVDMDHKAPRLDNKQTEQRLSDPAVQTPVGKQTEKRSAVS
jgi:hypothetical protein